MCYRFLNNVCLLVVSYNDYSTWYLIKKIKMSVEKSFKMPLNDIFLTIFVRMCLGHSGRLTFRPLVRSFENSHPFFGLMQNSSSNKANKQKNILSFTWLLINIKGKYKIDPLVFMWNSYFPENSTNRLFTHKEICRNFAVSRLSRRRKGNVWTLTLMLFDEGFVISCIYLSLWW